MWRIERHVEILRRRTRLCLFLILVLLAAVLFPETAFYIRLTVICFGILVVALVLIGAVVTFLEHIRRRRAAARESPRGDDLEGTRSPSITG